MSLDEAKRRGQQLVAHVGVTTHLLDESCMRTLCGKRVGDDDAYALATSITCGRCAARTGRPIIHPN